MLEIRTGTMPTVQKMFLSSARRNPERIAVELQADDEKLQRISYRKLLQMADAASGSLIRLDVGPSCVVVSRMVGKAQRTQSYADICSKSRLHVSMTGSV